jgi:hypothetical protein
MVDLDRVPVNEWILEAEAAWAGGVADFGDREAGIFVQQMPGYFDYRGTIEDELRHQLGDQFWMYRAMTEEAYQGWAAGEDVGPVGFTLNETFARGWKNFAGMERFLGGRELVIVQAPVRPEWVVMRGKAEEEEVVVDGNQVSFDTLERI